MTATSLLAQIAAQGFGGLLSNLATNYLQRSQSRITNDENALKTDLTDHFRITYDKCTKVKTILGDESSETLQIYVDQTFVVKDNHIDQYSMIETIRGGHSTIILGTGGGGKSMFMRYLWLAYFEKSDGKIPFFLELRNLNSLSHSRFEDFIFHSIIRSGSSIRQKDFNNGLRAGDFILFLDGFDEINFDRRDAVQDLIVEMQRRNPKLTIVLTSRPDERFIGWDGFKVARVASLSKASSKLLIERADYDEELKGKFLSKFEDLFSAYNDFLSNPLLAYMMLVTFAYNPDIPKRMFQFYEQAFEALYHRHDLTKGYKRKFHCNLDKIEFIRLTAFLCLKTYYDEEFEFSKQNLVEAIDSAKSIEDITVNSESFLDDLTQSVCLFKLEGITYTFTHRTFQEYFAAYCISRVAIRHIDTLFAQFARRFGDSVLPMVADINADLFREKFIVPNAKKFRDFINRKTERNIYEGYASRTGAVFTIHLQDPKKLKKRQNEGLTGIGLRYHGEMEQFARVIDAIARHDTTDADVERRARRDLEFVRFVSERFSGRCTEIYVFVHSGKLRVSSDRNIELSVFSPEEEESLIKEFRDTRMYDFIVRKAIRFLSFVRDELARYDQVSRAFKELF